MARKWKKDEISEYLSTKQISQDNYVAPTVETNFTPSVASTVDAFNSVQPTVKTVEPTISNTKTTASQPNQEEQKSFSFSIDNTKKTTEEAKADYDDAYNRLEAYQKKKGINLFNRESKKNKNDKEYQNLLKEVQEKQKIYNDSKVEKNTKKTQKELENANPVAAAAARTSIALGSGATRGFEGIESSVRKITGQEQETDKFNFNEPMINAAYQGANKGEQIAMNLAQSWGQMAPQMMMPGSKTATALGFLNYGGSAYNDAKREGATEEQATLYGIASGSTEMFMEKLLGGFENIYGKKMGKDFTGNVMKKLIKNKAVRDTLSGMKGEFTEEYLQEFLEPILKNIILQEDNGADFWNTMKDDLGAGLKQLGSQFFNQRNFEAGLQGSLSSGLLQGPQNFAISQQAKRNGMTYEEYLNSVNVPEHNIMQPSQQETLNNDINEIEAPNMDVIERNNQVQEINDNINENLEEELQEQQNINQTEYEVTNELKNTITNNFQEYLNQNNNNNLTKEQLQEYIQEQVEKSQNLTQEEKDNLYKLYTDTIIDYLEEVNKPRTNNEVELPETTQPTAIDNTNIRTTIDNDIKQQRNRELQRDLLKQESNQESIKRNLQNIQANYEDKGSKLLSETRQNDLANSINALNLNRFTQKEGNYVYKQSDNTNIDAFRRDAATYLKNTPNAQAFVKVAEKIIKDKKISIRFDSKLGNNVNGTYKNGVITINPNSNRAAEFIAIHELTHAIGTKSMIDMIQKYRNSNPEFNNAVEKLLSTYKTTEINEEALGDIAGQLFGNQEYINNLSMENPSLFKKIYNEIKYLWHQFTGYKNQDQFIEDLRNKWESAYRNQKIQQKAKNSNIEMSTQADSNGNMLSNEQVNYFKDSKVRDKDGNLLVMYHGTNEEFNVFKPSKWAKEISGENQIKGYFATNNSYSEIYGKTNPYYLNINNPLYMGINGQEAFTLNEWKDFFKKHGIDDIKFDSSLYGVNTKGTFSDADGNTRYLAFEIVDSDEYWVGDGNVTEKIKQAGYDGLKWTEGGTSYMPFESNQIKNIDNLTPTKSDDIRYSIEETKNNDTVNLKEKQNDIIQKFNPANEESTQTWIRSADDIKTLEETLQDSDWSDYDEFNPDLTKQDIENAIKTGKITVYSSYPIEQGIFVSPSKMEAESYSKNGKVYSKEVPIQDVAWIDPTQGQYAKVENQTNNKIITKDNTGRELSKQQQEYFKDSKIRNDKGDLEVFYHGSNNEFNVFDSTRKPLFNNNNVNFFTNNKDIADTYGKNKYELYIKSTNPYVLDGNTDGYSLEYSTTGQQELFNNKSLKPIKEKLDKNGGTYYKKSVAKICDTILTNKNNVLSSEEIQYLEDHPLSLAYLSVKAKDGFAPYGKGVMTNDLVNAVLSINKNTNNKYDSVLFKSIKDSGQYYNNNTKAELSDVIATFEPNQIKNVDNLNPTEDPDIRYSKDNQTWREYLEKEFPNQGTRTDLGEITGRKTKETTKTTTEQKKAQEMPKNVVKQETKREESKSYLTQAEQDDLDGLIALENSGWTELTKEEQARKEELEKKQKGIVKKYPDLKKNNTFNDIKNIYGKYKNNQISTENNKVLEQAKDIIQANSQGRRTIEQWNQVAEYIGSNSNIKNSQDLQKLAIETWFESKPNAKEHLNRQGKKYVPFAVQDWVNAVYKGAGVGTDVKMSLEEATDTKGKKVELQATGNNTYERVNTKPSKNQVMPDMSNETLNIGNKKVSNFYSNITEKSKFITEENRTNLQDNENLKYYDAITNKDTLQDAMDKLDKNAEQQIGDFFTKESFNAEDMATGWILIKRYQDAGNYEAMSNVIETMRDKGTKSGQAIQMLGMLNRLTPEGMEFYAQKQLDNAYKKFTENKSKKQIDKYANDFTLTPEEHQFIKDTMEKVDKMTNEDDKKVEVAKIVRMLSDKLPPEKGQRLKAWMRISMLGNPKTQVRNVVGNAIIQPFNWLGDTVASRIDKIMSKTTGIRTKGNTDFGALAGGFVKGAKEAVRDAKLGIDTRDINLDRFEENIGAKPFYEGHKNKALNVGAKVLNKTNQILGNVMSGGDRVFYQAIYDNSLKNQMKLNGVTTPTQQMMQIAEQEALSRTWNDSNEYTKAVLQIRNAMNKLNVKGYGLGDVLVPFAKTPANLTKAIVDYSPVGLVRSILQDGKNYKNSLQNGQYNAQIQHKFADSLGKGFAGTILWTAAYALAKAGIISGASDDDKDVANFMRNTLGIQPYSVKIGNKSFTYDWAQPIAAPFAAMADFMRLSEKEEKDLGSIVQTAVSSASNILLEQSFLSSIQDVFNSYEGPAAAIKQQIQDLPARATPTFFKQIADLIDPVSRQTYVKGNTTETLKNKVQVKIPGASKELASQRDTLGREITKYGGDEDKLKYAFNVFLNPANTNKGKPSKAAEEIYDVYKNTGNKTIMPRQVGYSENIGGKTVSLSAKERNEWQRLSGEKIEESVKALTSNSKYNSMSYEDKADVINGIVNYSFAKAKSDMFGTQISTQYKTAAKKEEQGIPIYDYYVDRISKRK